MNFLLYIALFIIFSPKFFIILGGRRVASVTLTDILFHALLFALGLYVVGYLTRTYGIFEGYSANKNDNKVMRQLRNEIKNDNTVMRQLRNEIRKYKRRNRNATEADIINYIRTGKQDKNKFEKVTAEQIKQAM